MQRTRLPVHGLSRDITYYMGFIRLTVAVLAKGCDLISTNLEARTEYHTWRFLQEGDSVVSISRVGLAVAGRKLIRDPSNALRAF